MVAVVAVTLALLCNAQMAAQVLTLNNTRYQVEYDVLRMTAQKVSWTLYKSDMGTMRRDAAGSFRMDKRVPKPRQVSSDYRNSGYQRGHLCPSADFSNSVSLMRETFLMSNVCPMTEAVNKGAWKRTEEDTRRMATIYDSVRVIVHVWWDSPHPWKYVKKKIPIPCAFGKQVFAARNDSLLMEWYVKQ